MAGGESSSTAESQAVDGPQTGKYTWVVKNFSKIRAKNIYSDSFVVGAWKWRVLLYPKGDGVDQLSAYVDVADKATLPYGWSRSASFNLSVINQSDRKGTVKRGAKHEFSARQNDWGFKSFMPLEELNDTSRGFLMNDTLIVEADVNIPRIVNYSAFDSKKVCVQKDQEEVERNRREKEEAERNKKEKEEEERRRKEEEEAERRRKDEEEPERRRKKEEEAEHKRKEKEEEERNKKEKEQEERRRKEEEQAERRRKEQEEAERKGKEKDEEERKRRQKEEQERKGKQIEEEKEEKEEKEQKRKDKGKEERKRKEREEEEGNKKNEEEIRRERKVKAEARLYTIIKVARDSDLKMQIGKHIHLDLVDHDNVKSFRMEKQTFFTEFKEEVENELGIPVICQRFWLWAKRHNHTCRPYRPLNEHEERQTVGSLKETSSQAHHAELKLFLEVSIPFLEQTIPVVPLEKTEEDVLLFFKLYNPEKEELRYVGRTFVKSYDKPMYILDTLKEMAGVAPSDEIDLYEEIQFTPNVMCEHIDKNSTFRASKLGDGDIICYQKARSNKKNIIYRYSDVPSFLEYVRNRQAVQFWRLEKPEEDGFCLELSKQHTYDEVVGKVAEQLGLADASKIRLTSYDCYTQRPKAQSIKYRGVDYLSDMLVHCNQSVQTWGILYFETLDLPLPELQRLKTLKVSFHNMKTERLSEHEIRLPKQSTMGDVIKELKGKVGLSSPTGELRIIEVFLHKIYRIFPSSEKIESINEQHWILRAEEIPEEEKHLGWQDRWIRIHVYHFTRDASRNHVVQNFGDPFFLVIEEHETLVNVKERIRKKLLIADEEFGKWQFAFVAFGHPNYLQDNDVVASRFQKRDACGAWEHYLGLEHAESAPKRTRIDIPLRSL